MGEIGIASQTVGNAFSNYYQGKAEMQSYEFEQQIADNNAFLAGQEARWARMATKERLSKHYREVGQVQASNRVAFAKSGVRLDSGSPLHSAISTAEQAEIDANIIKTEGEIEIYNASLKAMQYRTQGEIAEFKGKESKTAARFGIGSSLLKGGADIYNLWQSKKKKGY